MRYVIGMLLAVLAGPVTAGWSEDAETICTQVDALARQDRLDGATEVLHSTGLVMGRYDGDTSRTYSVCYVQMRRAHQCLHDPAATNVTCPADRRPAPPGVISICQGLATFDVDWRRVFRCVQERGYN